MNDDRKFKERAELVKQLLLVRISSDVIAKIAGISESTLTKDRVRVEKLYGIKVPAVASTNIERAERFRLLLKAFLEVKFETHNRRDPLYEAAKLTIDFEKIENHIYTIESLLEKLESPRFTSNNQMAKNYQKLIEHCIPKETYKEYSLLNEFYRVIHDGIIPMEEISNEQNLIELATKFCCDKDRSGINTTVIDDPKALVNTLFLALTGTQIAVLKSCYGLECKKKTLDEIGYELKLSRECVRQIREKSLRIIRNELNEKRYLIHSTDKYSHLEQQYAELEERYRKYGEETDQEIINLKRENARLRGIFEGVGEGVNSNDYSPIIQILIQPIRKTDFSIRLINSLCCYYDHVLDVIEDWDNLLEHRNFGKRSRQELNDYLLNHGIDRNKLTLEEKVLARQLIRRSK